MPPNTLREDVQPPWGPSTFAMAAGVLYMLSGVQLLAEAFGDTSTVIAIACVVEIFAGLAIVILGLNLVVNPFRHQTFGVAIIVVSGLATVAMLSAFSLAPNGAVLLFVSPAGGVSAGAWAILLDVRG